MFMSWSPNGRSVGFFADGKLKLLDIGSGAILDLAVAANGRGSSWSPDGTTILFARIGPFGLWRVPSQGGEAVEVTTLQPREIQHRWPRFVGVGSRFFYTVLDDESEPRRQGLYLGNLDGSKPVHLDDTTGHAEFFPPDRIIYYDSDSSAVVMQRIDLHTGQPAGERLTIAANVDAGQSGGQYSWANGVLAFQRLPSTRGSQLQWFSRAGPEGLVGSVADQQRDVELAPNGRRAVISRSVNGNSDIYLIDTHSGGSTRLTTATAPDVSPIWSADGRAIYFASTRDGRKGVWRKGVDDGSQESLLTDAQALEPLDASNDTLLLRGTAGVINTLLSLKLDGRPSAPASIAAAGSSAQHGQLSPDGRWLAYTAMQDTGIDVWMKRLDSDGPGRQVTTGRGYQPRWGSDGRTLYYLSPSSELMAMPMSLRAEGFEAGTPVPLFRIPLRGFAGNNSAFGYDVTRDGRFLVNADRTQEPPITVVLNWTPR
jgi:Tol biopolymer transport system component